MKRYLENLQSKSPHERRTHAFQVAAACTVFAGLVWFSTLGLRFAAAQPQQPTGDDTQAASVVESQSGNATLIVATTSDTLYGQ